MDKKLTLSLDGNIIEKAKEYARSNEVSLSKLVESYLSSLLESNTEEVEITPLVESLIGIIDIPEDFDETEGYTNYLLEKYK